MGRRREIGGGWLAGFARWSVRRRGRVLEAALVLAAILLIAALGVEDRLASSGFTARGTEAAEADEVLAERFKATSADLVLVARAGEPVTSARAGAAGRRLTRYLAEQPGVARVQSYWAAKSPLLVSRDGRSAIVAVDLAGDDARAARTAQRVVPAVARAFAPLRISATGPTWANVEFIEQGKSDQRRAELVIAPLAMLILLIAFKSVFAALVPAVIGALALIGTMAGLRLLTYLMDVSVFAPNLATALGFGLAVDYSLFIITRFREELARGLPVPVAVERSMAVAGRTVLFSALTVAVAVAGLFVFPVDILRSLAWAAITVVVLCAASSLLVLPALLAVLGDRVNRGDPFARWRKAQARPVAVRAMTGRAALRAAVPVSRVLVAGGAVVLAFALFSRARGVGHLAGVALSALARPVVSPRLPVTPPRPDAVVRLWRRTAARLSRRRTRPEEPTGNRFIAATTALRAALVGGPIGRPVGGPGSGPVGGPGREAIWGAAGSVLLGWAVGRLRRRRAEEHVAEDRIWRRIAEAATRRPILLGGGTAVLLVLLAMPFAHARFGVADERILPAGAESHATARHVGRAFAHVPDRQIKIVLPRATEDERLAEYARRLATASPHVTRVQTVTGTYTGKTHKKPGKEAAAYRAGKATLVDVATDVPPQSKAAGRMLDRLREVPAPGERLITGRAAQVDDTLTAMADALPIAGALIAVATLVLLFLFVGGVLVSVKAIVLGALSLTASAGAIVAVFQDGNLGWLVGDFTRTGRLEAMTLLITFTVAFGLSMDYEVFLLSRIKERYQATGDHARAVVGGIAGTGRLITAAASVIALSTGFLVTSGNTVLKMNGLGLALAVLMDATIVRGVLVPAFMQLTGRANWWAPEVLARVHRRVGLTETQIQRKRLCDAFRRRDK
ncbi:MMPL family transporter [Nonomuraea sp. NN258]|uniref:MMPL family transporter n=1 Tax=Nonomuraea antri TaxID=2730852 RepID=UPI001567E0C0|nr:MMPL family transporter [Nonomuraea antri]NRQ33619.1 MMPL family transporter [Nonomuraea antri]